MMSDVDMTGFQSDPFGPTSSGDTFFENFSKYSIPGVTTDVSSNVPSYSKDEAGLDSLAESLSGPDKTEKYSLSDALKPASSNTSSLDESMTEQMRNIYSDALNKGAETGKPIEQILKEYGLSDKVVSSLIQVGGGMLAGASQAKMAEKNRNATWQREDEVIAKTRALREANSRAGTVGKLNYKPTGLLEAMKK